jgi:hypothetical protein
LLLQIQSAEVDTYGEGNLSFMARRDDERFGHSCEKAWHAARAPSGLRAMNVLIVLATMLFDPGNFPESSSSKRNAVAALRLHGLGNLGSLGTSKQIPTGAPGDIVQVFGGTGFRDRQTEREEVGPSRAVIRKQCPDARRYRLHERIETLRA